MPIDHFLRSAAEQCGRRTIGVVLSGTGLDGSAGVAAIKAAGGRAGDVGAGWTAGDEQRFGRILSTLREATGIHFSVYREKIDLLVTDVVMPVLGGRQLAEGARKLRPDLKVLFVSGHTEDVVLKEGIEKGAPFLQKPFSPSGLAEKVREVLDSKARAMGGE